MGSWRVGPWRFGDVSQQAFVAALGLSAVTGAWYGSSGELIPSHQLGWLTLGVVGCIIAGVGNANWLMSGCRAVSQRRRAIADLYETTLGDVSSAVVTTPSSRRGTALVAVSGRALYHRISCPLVTGRTTSP